MDNDTRENTYTQSQNIRLLVTRGKYLVTAGTTNTGFINCSPKSWTRNLIRIVFIESSVSSTRTFRKIYNVVLHVITLPRIR